MVAFENHDGSKVLAFANGTNQAATAMLEAGAEALRLDVPAASMNTVVIHRQNPNL